MKLTVRIPDEFAQRFAATSTDLSRHILEVLALDEYKSGHLTQAELRRLLGLETRDALDGFLKAHGVFIDYTVEDLEQERRDLQRLGF
jgi:hypothetical protein